MMSGIVLCRGMEFDIPTGEIIFDGRFAPGVIATDRETDQDGRNNVRQLDRKNYLASFMLGYAFRC